VLAEAADAL